MKFITTINRLHEFEITEKLDGAQILFGIDELGFYTSRETKGGVRIYNEQNYGHGFPATYMRSAHKLLEQAMPLLKEAGLRLGDQVEAEVLYGKLPNVVPYSADTNYLIFLRTTEGVVNIDRLKQKLDSQSISVTLQTPYTLDGRFIDLKEETNTWEFSRAPKISANVANVQHQVRGKISALTCYLRENSGIENFSNQVISGLTLNKCPEWCPPQNWKFLKGIIKEKRKEIVATIREQHVPAIKEVLLNHLVRNQKSSFGPTLEKGGWIEGVVFRDKITGNMIKLVDKDVFGTIRESAWKERNLLTEAAKSVESKHSFLADIYISLARSIGHPELGTMQAKNYLRKAGAITEERVSTISVNVNFGEVREYWLNILEEKEHQLQVRLDKYAKEEDSSAIHSGIKERNLQTFATTFEKIFILQEATLQAKKAEDLVVALVGRHLGEI